MNALGTAWLGCGFKTAVLSPPLLYPWGSEPSLLSLEKLTRFWSASGTAWLGCSGPASVPVTTSESSPSPLATAGAKSDPLLTASSRCTSCDDIDGAATSKDDFVCSPSGRGGNCGGAGSELHGAPVLHPAAAAAAHTGPWAVTPDLHPAAAARTGQPAALAFHPAAGCTEQPVATELHPAAAHTGQPVAPAWCPAAAPGCDACIASCGCTYWAIGCGTCAPSCCCTYWKACGACPVAPAWQPAAARTEPWAVAPARHPAAARTGQPVAPAWHPAARTAQPGSSALSPAAACTAQPVAPAWCPAVVCTGRPAWHPAAARTGQQAVSPVWCRAAVCTGQPVAPAAVPAQCPAAASTAQQAAASSPQGPAAVHTAPLAALVPVAGSIEWAGWTLAAACTEEPRPARCSAAARTAQSGRSLAPERTALPTAAELAVGRLVAGRTALRPASGLDAEHTAGRSLAAASIGRADEPGRKAPSRTGRAGRRLAVVCIAPLAESDSVERSVQAEWCPAAECIARLAAAGKTASLAAVRIAQPAALGLAAAHTARAGRHFVGPCTARWRPAVACIARPAAVVVVGGGASIVLAGRCRPAAVRIGGQSLAVARTGSPVALEPVAVHTAQACCSLATASTGTGPAILGCLTARTAQAGWTLAAACTEEPRPAHCSAAACTEPLAAPELAVAQTASPARWLAAVCTEFRTALGLVVACTAQAGWCLVSARTALPAAPDVAAAPVHTGPQAALRLAVAHTAQAAPRSAAAFAVARTAQADPHFAVAGTAALPAERGSVEGTARAGCHLVAPECTAPLTGLGSAAVRTAHLGRCLAPARTALSAAPGPAAGCTAQLCYPLVAACIGPQTAQPPGPPPESTVAAAAAASAAERTAKRASCPVTASCGGSASQVAPDLVVAHTGRPGKHVHTALAAVWCARGAAAVAAHYSQYSARTYDAAPAKTLRIGYNQ
eukprot:1181505-Prorocentrum_minimum.AAC.2